MDFFPVLFVVPRVVGWLAHWRQVGVGGYPRVFTTECDIQMMMQEGGVKIWRPRQARSGFIPGRNMLSLFRSMSALARGTMFRSRSDRRWRASPRPRPLCLTLGMCTACCLNDNRPG